MHARGAPEMGYKLSTNPSLRPLSQEAGGAGIEGGGGQKVRYDKVICILWATNYYRRISTNTSKKSPTLRKNIQQKTEVVECINI